MQNKNHRFFICGTDTNVGKTYVSIQILHALQNRGLSTIALKPVASGCKQSNGIWFNDDALALQQAASIKLAYHHVNPVALELPLSPHIAAARMEKSLSVDTIFNEMQYSLNYSADVQLIESAGGWYTPLNHRETMADLAMKLNIAVILVVGIRLGCINHAILTDQAIRQTRLNYHGWIANEIEPRRTDGLEIIDTLQHCLSGKYLGFTPYEGTLVSKENFNIGN